MIRAGALGVLALAACAPEPAPTLQISPEARAKLPPGTDLTTIRRREDGCYFYVFEDELSGVIRAVKDIRDEPVCDDLPLWNQ